MVSGRVTAELELAKKGKFAPIENIPVNVETVSNKSSGKKHYEIIMDSRGTLLWKDDSGYDKDMLIITSETVSKEYLEYLDQKHISYIASGEEKNRPCPSDGDIERILRREDRRRCRRI